jgi:hypothetical protein
LFLFVTDLDVADWVLYLSPSRRGVEQSGSSLGS